MQETEMDFESRIVTSDFTPEDNDIENSLRPKVLDDYIGQDKVKENLAVYIQAARGRGEALDHVLLYGPPGLGKTTLAGVIANEMGVNLRVTSGPAIENRAIWQLFLLIFKKVTFCLLMRFTVLTGRLRKFFIRLWRMGRSILLSAKVLRQGQ